MADTTDDRRQKIRKSRQDIADTRSALTQKLTMLEGRLQETAETVKHTVDLDYHVKQRPWLMFGGSLLAGYALGRRCGVSSATADTSNAPAAPAQPQHSIVSAVSSQVRDDLATLKGAAMAAVISTLWAMAKQVLLPPVRQVGITKLGAQPLDNPQPKTTRDIGSKTNGREMSSFSVPHPPIDR